MSNIDITSEFIRQKSLEEFQQMPGADPGIYLPIIEATVQLFEEGRLTVELRDGLLHFTVVEEG